MSKTLEQSCADFLKEVGLDDGEGTVEHLKVMLRCLQTFGVRNGRHHDLWRSRGMVGCAFHIDSKASRIASRYIDFGHELKDVPEELDDDAIDIINYAVFLLRNQMEGALRGVGR